MTGAVLTIHTSHTLTCTHCTRNASLPPSERPRTPRRARTPAPAHALLPTNPLSTPSPLPQQDEVRRSAQGQVAQPSQVPPPQPGRHAGAAPQDVGPVAPPPRARGGFGGQVRASTLFLFGGRARERVSRGKPRGPCLGKTAPRSPRPHRRIPPASARHPAATAPPARCASPCPGRRSCPPGLAASNLSRPGSQTDARPGQVA